MVLMCQYCNKEFSSYQSRCNHIRKFHKEIKDTLSSTVGLHMSNNVNKCQPINIETVINKKNYECSKCNKKFNTRQARWKHEKICENNKSDSLKVENELLKKRLEEKDILFKKELEEIKKQMASQMESIKTLLCKEAKIHPPGF
jgi:hypothetical protein